MRVRIKRERLKPTQCSKIRRAQVVMLRNNERLSYRQIGKRLGINHVAAWQHYQRALELAEATFQEDVKACREQDSARLQALIGEWLPRAMKGDEKAVDKVVKLMERRAKLLGLDTQPDAAFPSSPFSYLQQLANLPKLTEGQGYDEPLPPPANPTSYH